MWRDLFVSATGHIIIFGSLIFSSTFGVEPRTFITVHQITAVTPQQIERLLKNTPAREERVSKVPQVQVKRDEIIPKRTRRSKQTVKRPASQEGKQTGKKKKDSEIKGIKTDTEFDYPDYLIEMRDRIFRNWRYPILHESLTTTVYFRIAKNGRIISIKMEKATGNVSFDRSAWEAVQKSNPFNPLPEEFSENELGVHFNFIYDQYL